MLVKRIQGFLVALIALIWGPLVLFPGISPAATPAGTEIQNLAPAEFLFGIENRSSSSNQTTVTISTITEISIDAPHNRYIQAGKSISILHTVSNNGNVDDTIDLEAASALGLTAAFFASDGTTLLTDTDSDGKIDAGSVSAQGSVDIVVRLSAPEALEDGQIDETVITATSSVNPSVKDSVADRLTILAAKFWDPLVKTADPPGQLTQESVITYTNTFGNAGGIPATNVVITDPLDANLIYVEGSAAAPQGIQGTSITYDPIARTITWAIPSIPPGYVGSISFKARINPDTQSDTVVSNLITITSDEIPGGEISNGTETIVVEQPLRISKTSGVKTAEIGDYVTYSIDVGNTGKTMTAYHVSVIDDLPKGFRYLRKSSSLDNAETAEPEVGDKIKWDIGTLAPGSRKTLTYRALISIDAPLGNGVNRAEATGKSPGGNNLFTPAVTSTVKVKEGVLNSKGIILGRVFDDENRDGMPDEKEKGIKGVRLYLEDGTYAVTDEEGKFSIAGIEAGEHVLKIDRGSVPGGGTLTPLDGSFAGDGGSRFISVPFGGPARGDFAVVFDSEETAAQQPQDNTGKNKKYSFGTEPVQAPATLEQQIQNMPASIAILEPPDGESLQRPWRDIVIRVPENAEYELKVNDVPVKPEKIGKTIHETLKGILIHQYVSVGFIPGQNRITLEAAGPDGEGATIAIGVYAPGAPEAIAITPGKADIPADGKTEVPFKAQLLDKWGRPSLEERVVTVVTGKGAILEEDLDPTAPGHQLKAIDGRLKFTLRSTLKTGRDEITVLSGSDLRAKADVYFTPGLRDWIIVGIADVTAGDRGTSGNVEEITEDDAYEKGIFHDERLAFFLKGKVLGKYLLTAAYDSDKEKKEDGLFQQVEPDRYYPVYGDSGESGHEAESQDKLYIKIEKDRSSVMYGDYHTDLTKNEFARYDRTFNGVKADMDTEHFSLKTFGAYTHQTFTKDELQGNGTSGFYFLSRSPVIENSEKVRIETRDRYHPERTLSSVEKTRYIDYTIDYTGGRILFNQPVPSVDSGLDPVFIVITYESDDPGDKFYIYGGRAGIKTGNGSEIGITGVVEEQELKDTTLIGADAKVRITGSTGVSGEIAASSANEKESDRAWKVELNSAPLDKLTTNVYYRSVGEDFHNPSMSGSETGTEKFGAKLGYAFTGKTLALAEHFVQDNKINGTKLSSSSLGLQQDFARASAEGGYMHLREERPGGDIKESQVVFTGVKGLITDKLDASIRRDQLVTPGGIEDYQTKTAMGLNYKLNEAVRAFVTQEFQEGGENRRDTTLAGIESRVTENTTLSSRYQMENAASGERNQGILGLNNKWEIQEGLTLNTTAERVQELRGDSGGDNTALTLSAEYFPEEGFKATGRYEYRLGEEEITNLVTFGAGSRLNNSASLLARMSLWNSSKDEGNDALVETSLGLAYRPAGKKSIYMLTVVQFNLERRGSSATDDRSKKFITSTEASYRINPRWTLLGKYAGKYAWEDIGGRDFEAYTDMIIAGVSHDITKKWEAAVLSKFMNQYQTKMHSAGYIIKTGYNVAKNLSLGIGYNSSELNDRDLSGESYRAHGVFIDMKIKFDEDALKSLDRLRHIL